MRFPLRWGACVLVLSAHAGVFAASRGPAPDAGLCAVSPAWGLSDDDRRDEPAAAVAAAPTAADKRGETAAAEPPEMAAVNLASFSPAHAPLLEEAYADALDVLSGDEECSAFFGGRVAAGHVLGRLVGQLREESMNDPKIGIRMKGTYSTIHDLRTGARFRLFESAAVNRRGPFFRTTHGGKELADCGSFAPNTRGARASMLLHELGHLIRGADGHWLLPNDGHDQDLVTRNTARIEKSCGRSIKALGGRDEAADPGGLTARLRR